MRGMGLAGMVAVVLLTVGCTSTTRINFQGPPGAVMFVDKKPYHLPAQIELSRPGGDSGSKRHGVSVAFTAQQGRDVRANGYIDVFGYTESDLDKTAFNPCILDESQLLKTLDGTVVVFRGQSASRQPLYDLTLGKKP
jgi:hypothetical protein